MEGRLKILRVMNTIKGKLSLQEFAEMVGLTRSQTLEYTQELVKTGFVRKFGRGYSITEKGKAALKAFNPVPEGSEFHFCTGIGRRTGLSAKSLKDFCELVGKVDVAALEFHVSRGDFENWIKNFFDDSQFASEFTRIRKLTLKGESLRNEVVKATEARRREFEKLLSF